MHKSFIIASTAVLLASAGAAAAQNTADVPAVSSISVIDFGTGAPSATCEAIEMEQVPVGHACTGESPGAAASSFGPVTPSPASGQRCIGSGWATWSHGYTGEVWYTGGSTSQTITLPAGVNAAYAYVEPNPFGEQTCEMTAVGSSGAQSTGSFPVVGDSGARGFCFVEDAGTISQIQVSCDSDFATGEYGVGAGGENPCDYDGDGDYDRNDLVAELVDCIRAGSGGCFGQVIRTVLECGRPAAE